MHEIGVHVSYLLLEEIVVEGEEGGVGHAHLMEYVRDEAWIPSQLTTVLL